MIDLIVRYIVDLITGSIDKMLYYMKIKKAKKELNDAKSKAKDSKHLSDSAYNDFQFKLQQYRKSRRGELRRSLGKLRDSGGETKADDKRSANSDSKAGSSD